jgi:hypothetical protein
MNIRLSCLSSDKRKLGQSSTAEFALKFYFWYKVLINLDYLKVSVSTVTDYGLDGRVTISGRGKQSTCFQHQALWLLINFIPRSPFRSFRVISDYAVTLRNKYRPYKDTYGNSSLKSIITSAQPVAHGRSSLVRSDLQISEAPTFAKRYPSMSLSCCEFLIPDIWSSFDI